MGIKNVIKLSLTDWDGKVATVIFLGGCNFKCPYCQNWPLAINPDALKDTDYKEYIEFIKESSDWLDGVVITGGEPTCYRGLVDVIKDIKSHGLRVKMDTNGSNPDVLRDLIGKGLLDFVSMDVKNSIEKYSETADAPVNTDNILESISILKEFGSYEFRTTVVPGLVEFEDLEKICNIIKGSNIYVLQRYHPENVVNKKFSEITPQSDEEMDEMTIYCSKHVPTKWRG